MRYIRNGKVLLVMTLAVSITAWGQGRRAAGRGAETQQSGTPAATQAAPASAPTPAAGRGGRFGPVAPETSEFYNYDASAGAAPAFSDARPSETHGKLTVNGEALAYTAHAGYMPLRNATTGNSEAHIFYTAYSKDGSDTSSRPLVFFFGGAPGVSAAWQEFGGLGPKRMKWAEDGTAGPAPYRWTDNPSTLLGEADLVFVNPVGTAYSRPDHPSAGPKFWNTAADVASLAGFVRTYLSLYSRQNSPLFLAGEDRGTGRVAGLAAYLTEHEVPVHGVVLLSMNPSADATAGDAEFLTLFPSLVMSSWYHKKLSPELNAMSAEQISSQARQFASREYLHALYKGERMTADERTKVIADMARLTGLSKSFLVNNDLRVSLERYSTELMREQHKGLSYSDARVSGFVPAAGGGRGGRGGFGFGAPVVIDFNLSNLSGGLQTAYEAYLGQDLSFKEGNHGVFYLSSGGTGTFTANGDDAALANALARNPNLRLFVAIDYYDLKAPFYATEFTLAHLSVSPEVRSRNIRVAHFEAGQMSYVDNKALVKLHSDLARFLSDATSPARKGAIE